MLAIAWVETLRLMRTPAALTLIFIVPAFQVVLFGYAIRPDSGTVKTAIAAPTPTAGAPIAERISHERGIILSGQVRAPGEAERAVRAGEVGLAIEIPEVRSFANPLAPNRPVRVIIDAAEPSISEPAIARLTAAYWQAMATRDEEAGPAFVVERLHNKDARADWAFLPALIGVTVMITMVMLGCLSLAREREGGTWEALLALPMNRGELLAGKALPYVAIGTVEGLVVLALGVGLFDLPARGNVLALCALLPVFAAAHFLIGYAISARARTQIAALQGAVAFYLPAMLLSGFLYPRDTLPQWAQTIGAAFPLTPFIAAARDILLRGQGAAVVGHALIPIGGVAMLAATLAIVAQSRRLD